VDKVQEIMDSGLSVDSQVNVIYEVLKNVLDEGAVRARSVRHKVQKHMKSKNTNERVYALNKIASDGKGIKTVPEEKDIPKALEDTYKWISEELARKYIQNRRSGRRSASRKTRKICG